MTSLIGAALTAAFRVVTSGRLSPGTPQISFQIVLSLVFVVLPKCDDVRNLRPWLMVELK